MHIVIAGSGPVGMTAALLLARGGHRVTLVDRDPGPVEGRVWDRVGVMQFHLPHGFRPQCRNLLHDRLPDVHRAVLEAGAEELRAPGEPESTAMLSVRRSVFERALWERASVEPGIARITGHVDGIEIDGSRAVGVVVDSGFAPADLVVDASGRSARLSAPFRPLRRRVDCGMAYASRQYRLRDGATPGPFGGGPAWMAHHPGFLALVFPHDDGVFTVLIVRPSADKALALLREPAAFEAACRAIPGLAEWTDPERSSPIDVVRAGAGLTNEYSGQTTAIGGLVAIGDAFASTNPQGGRGISLGLMSAAALADLIGEVVPIADLPARLDEWGSEELLPWFLDHVDWDASLLASWAGRPVDPNGPIGLEVLVGAAQRHHPEWMATLQQFFGMQVKPAALAPLRDLVRELVRQGWQPAPAGGISRDELADLVRASLVRTGLVGVDRAEPIPA